MAVVLAEAAQLSAALAFPGVAVNPVGAGGIPIGVAETAADAVPSPAALTARTLNVYAVPLVSPVKLCPVLLAAATHVAPLSFDTL